MAINRCSSVDDVNFDGGYETYQQPQPSSPTDVLPDVRQSRFRAGGSPAGQPCGKPNVCKSDRDPVADVCPLNNAQKRLAEQLNCRPNEPAVDMSYDNGPDANESNVCSRDRNPCGGGEKAKQHERSKRSDQDDSQRCRRKPGQSAAASSGCNGGGYEQNCDYEQPDGGHDDTGKHNWPQQSQRNPDQSGGRRNSCKDSRRQSCPRTHPKDAADQCRPDESTRQVTEDKGMNTDRQLLQCLRGIDRKLCSLISEFQNIIRNEQERMEKRNHLQQQQQCSQSFTSPVNNQQQNQCPSCVRPQQQQQSCCSRTQKSQCPGPNRPPQSDAQCNSTKY